MKFGAEEVVSLGRVARGAWLVEAVDGMKPGEVVEHFDTEVAGVRKPLESLGHP